MKTFKLFFIKVQYRLFLMFFHRCSIYYTLYPLTVTTKFIYLKTKEILKERNRERERKTKREWKSVLFTNIILFFYCVCFCYIARDIYILRSLCNSFYDGNSLLFSVFMVLYPRAQIRVIPSFWIKLMYIYISFFGFSLLIKNLCIGF